MGLLGHMWRFLKNLEIELPHVHFSFDVELQRCMVCTGFPDSSAGKESACNAGDPGLIPGLGRSAGEGKRLPTPVSWPGEFHGLYSPRDHKESDVTE